MSDALAEIDGLQVAFAGHDGALTPAVPIPEAARVELGEQRGSLVRVRWGSIEGWTQSDAVRRLARP